MLNIPYTLVSVKEALQKTGYKGNEDDVLNLFMKINGYSSMKYGAVKKVEPEFHMVEMLTNYARLTSKERKLYRKLIEKHDLFIDGTVRKIVYKRSLDSIFYWNVFDWDTIEVMFIIIRKLMEFKQVGFKSRSEQILIRDFARKILLKENSIYADDFKTFITKEYDIEGKKILMEVVLGGK